MLLFPRLRARPKIGRLSPFSAFSNLSAEVCQKCLTSTIYLIDSPVTAEAVLPDAELLLFKSRVAGITGSLFGLANSFPPLVVGFYGFDVVGVSKEVCVESANFTDGGQPKISVSDIIGADRGPQLSFQYSICADCVGGLSSLSIEKIFLRQNSSTVLYGRVEASIEDINLIGPYHLGGIAFQIIYNQKTGYDVVGEGTLLKGNATEGAGIAVTMGQTNITVDIDLVPLNLQLWKFVKDVGQEKTVQVPDPNVQSRLNSTTLFRLE